VRTERSPSPAPPGEDKRSEGRTENDQVASARDGFVVMLDVAIDDGLAREGLARELNRAAQDLRKRARLPYDARVQLAIVSDAGAGAPAALERCLQDHGAWLCEQAGSADLVRRSLGSAIATTLDVDGAAIAVELLALRT
jgi:hypothetical protein